MDIIFAIGRLLTKAVEIMRERDNLGTVMKFSADFRTEFLVDAVCESF